MHFYVYASLFFIGFFGFAALQYLLMWLLSRHERVLLIFSLNCLTGVGLFGSIVALTTTHSVDDYQTALNCRTCFALLGFLSKAWILPELVGERWRRFTWGITAPIVALLFIDRAIMPLNGAVLQLHDFTLPWGETITLAERIRHAGWMSAVYTTGLVTYFVGIVAAIPLWTRDRTAAILMIAANLVCVLVVGAATMVDVLGWRMPYLGALPNVAWVLFIGVLLSKEYGRRRLAVEESEERFRGAFDHAAIGMALVAPDGRWLKVNQSLCDLVGYTREELLKRDFQSITHPDDLALDLEYVRRILAGEIDVYQMEKRYLRKGGEPVWIVLSVSLMRDAANRPLYFISQMQSIQERKAAEQKMMEAVRRHEELLALLDTLYAQAPIGLAFVDNDFRFVRLNEALAEMNGKSSAEHLGHTVESVVPELWGELREIYNRVKSEGISIVDRELSGETAAQPGVRRYWYVSYYPVNVTGRTIGIGLIVNEITEHKRFELALSASEARSRAILHALPDWMFQIDALGRILDYSAADSYGGDPDPQKFVGKHLSEFLPRDVATTFQAHMDQATQYGRSQLFEYELDVPGRGKQSFEARIASCGEGETIAIVRNVSGRHELEDKLRHAQKMEAVGRMAGGIAHDFNNLLTVISTYSNLLLERAEETDPTRKWIVSVTEAAERATKLTRQILAISRRQLLKPQVCDLNEVVHGLEQLLLRLIRSNIRLTLDVAPQPCPVKIDRTQIEQVLINLAINASDAMPDGGELTISTSNRDAWPPRDVEDHSISTTRSVHLMVRDTGTGIEPQHKAQIFEPFFTTKSPGKGTGLGLAVVYGIIEQSGGDIRVESEVRRGTTFHVTLPYTLERVVPAPERSGAVPQTSRRLIMVVDDESQIRDCARDILQTAGFGVIEFADGETALHEFERRIGEISVLLTDLSMPSMSGRELARRFRQRRADVPVVMMSGSREPTDHDVMTDDAFWIEKPFLPSTLVTAIQRAMAAPRDKS